MLSGEQTVASQEWVNALPFGLTGAQGVTGPSGVGGSSTYAVVGVSGAEGYTAMQTSGTTVLAVNTGYTGTTIYLPTAVGNTAMFVAKKTDALNTLTVEGFDAETIDGYTSSTLSALNESKTFVSDNSNWLVL
jgi:hypothetical protein